LAAASLLPTTVRNARAKASIELIAGEETIHKVCPF
jgi:hypothetical protein